MTRKPDTYEDFVAWRDARDCEAVTVGDAMRYFTGTPLPVLLQWWKRDQAGQFVAANAR
jgi:hypothetical protein